MKWHDYIIAGVIPIIFTFSLGFREFEALKTFIGYTILWYFFFLGIIYVMRYAKVD